MRISSASGASATTTPSMVALMLGPFCRGTCVRPDPEARAGRSGRPLALRAPVIPLSVLDLVPITAGSTPRVALQRSLDLARHAERLGYRRFWVAEHHNMTGIASAATSVVVG